MSFFMHTFNRISSLSPLQLAQKLALDVRDEALIEELCIAAQASPTAMRSLHWAVLNNVKLTVGGTQPGVLGCYNYLSRRITMSEGLRNCIGAEEVGTLVHEIRHAWQDMRDLLPHLNTAHYRLNRLDYAQAQNALCEADAAAFGRIATAELHMGEEAAREFERNGQRQATMQGFFFEWFDDSSSAYGRNMREAHNSSIASSVADTQFPPVTGINPYDRADVVNLGRDFFGNRNYLADIERDVFARRLLNPQNILRDFNAPETAPVQGSEIVKAQMRNRHALAAQMRGGR